MFENKANKGAHNSVNIAAVDKIRIQTCAHSPCTHTCQFGGAKQIARISFLRLTHSSCSLFRARKKCSPEERWRERDTKSSYTELKFNQANRLGVYTMYTNRSKVLLLRSELHTPEKNGPTQSACYAFLNSALALPAVKHTLQFFFFFAPQQSNEYVRHSLAASIAPV